MHPSKLTGSFACLSECAKDFTIETEFEDTIRVTASYIQYRIRPRSNA